MKLDYSIRTCDICRKRIYDDITWNKPGEYGPITILKQTAKAGEWGEVDIYNEPIKFKDICDDCRKKISNFILENLYKEDKPIFNVEYLNEKVEALETKEE